MKINNLFKKNTSCHYTASHIANYFLIKAQVENISDMSVMKLIKLVYIAYAWYYAANEEKLFDEKIEAWRYGPVVPSLYHEFKRFGNQPIDGFSINSPEDISPVIASDDILTSLILLRVWKNYKKNNAGKLSNITHGYGSFWDKVYNSSANEEIPYEEQLLYIKKGAETGIKNIYGTTGIYMKDAVKKWIEKERLR